MKTIDEFLSHLRNLDVEIWAEGDRLRYSAPEEFLTPALLEQLREYKAEILAFLQQANTAVKSDLTPIFPATSSPLHGDWPAGALAFVSSYAQARLWFVHQMDPGLTAYHMPALWRLRGDLDVFALEQALAALIERHPTLRTTFQLHGREVLQIIHPLAPFPLAAEPLGDRDSDAVIDAWLNQEHSTPFDLSSGLMLRARLLVVHEKEHLLLINHHHIASDGWSLSVLARDLVELYNAERTGRSPQLEPLCIHYSDYAAWQRQRLSGERLQELNDYWIGQLRNLEPLELPSDHPRPVTPSYRGGNVCFQIEPQLLEPFEELCRREGATLQMGLLAVVALLLHRTSRQDEVAIGVPFWGRNHPELENLIGFFINTLPIRTCFQTNQTFRDLLRQVKEASIAAYDHQELPFEQMVEALNVERDTSRNPLVQVMLQLMELPEAGLEQLDGLAVQSLPTGSDSAKLDLSFYLCRSADQGLSASITYATDLFDGDRIERLTGHLRTLLGSALEAPDAAVDALNLLPEAERQLIESWQQGPVVAVQELCVHELFEQQVQRTPEAIALVFEEQSLTYAELNIRANRLAHHLIDLGIRPDDRVAIGVERSLEMVVGLLAILKAGGEYVPLDPAYPEERLAFMLEDSAPVALLVHGATRERLAALAGEVPMVDLEAELTAWAERSDTNPEPAALGLGPNHLAYVIYTSGSTGKPKGVMVEHRHAVNFIDWAGREFPAEVLRRTLFATSISFDLAVFECFVPLSVGGASVIVRNVIDAGPVLAEVTLINTVPSAIVTLLRSVPLPNVRAVNLAGEQLRRDLAESLFRSSQVDHLRNLYGPSETTTYSSWVTLRRDEGFVPHIGRPIANTRIYVLDGDIQPVPIGVAGEIHIGGAGVARGYLNRPELTAERFLQDPYSDEPGARMYRTGDLARWLPDGNLEFLGRVDFQVKIRGFRIELGEIEAALRGCDGIREAVVLAREDWPGEKRLVAYVTVAGSADTAANTVDTAGLPAVLKAHLQSSLPEYMVPAAFVVLEALPLTPNGKLDRRALPAPSFSGDLQQRAEPSTELELQLHALWAEVLGHGEFGISDNFFLVGGHSLAVARLVSRIEQILGSAPPLAALFQNPTIAGLASLLVGSSDVADSSTERRTSRLQPQTQLKPGSSLVAIQSGGSKRPFFLVPGGSGGKGELSIYAKLLYLLGQEQPVYGFQARGWDGTTNPHNTVKAMAADYIKEIRTVQPEGPYLLGGECIGGVVALEMAQQLFAQGKKVALLAFLDTAIPTLPRELYYNGVRCFQKIRRIYNYLRKLQSLFEIERLTYIFNQTSKVKEKLAENSSSRHLKKVGKNYIKIIKHYRPRAYPGRITWLVTESFSPNAQNLEWNHIPTGGLEIHQIAGTHNSYLGNNVETTAERLKTCLDKAQADD